MSATPPWGDVTHLGITNLSDYFITANGSNLIDMMIRVFEQAISVNKKVEIDTI
nr:Imm70 family immunity protein [Streptococcus entericus]